MPPSCFGHRLARGARTLVVCLSLFLSGSSLAYGGFTVGLFAEPPSGGSFALSARVVQPLITVPAGGTDLELSVRSDVAFSLSFRSPPSLGLAGVSSASIDGIERYLGAGAGVGFVSGTPLWSVYGLAGFRVPIASRLHGVMELQFSSNQLITTPQLGLAIEYSLGGK